MTNHNDNRPLQCPCHRAALMYSHYFETRDGVKVGVWCCKHGAPYIDFGPVQNDDTGDDPAAALEVVA